MHVGVVFKQCRDECGDLQDSEVHGVYSSLDRANMLAESLCDSDCLAWFEIHEVVE